MIRLFLLISSSPFSLWFCLYLTLLTIVKLIGLDNWPGHWIDSRCSHLRRAREANREGGRVCSQGEAGSTCARVQIVKENTSCKYIYANDLCYEIKCDAFLEIFCVISLIPLDTLSTSTMT